MLSYMYRLTVLLGIAPLVAAVLLVLAPLGAGQPGAVPSPPGPPEGAKTAAAAGAVEFFETSVRPVLAENCFSCHGEKRQRAGLRLDSRTGLMTGRDTGPVLVAGEPEKSLLIRAIRYQDQVKMPPRGRLPESAIATLTRWVQMGAPWPEDRNTGAAEAAKVPREQGAGNGGVDPSEHWAFQPLVRPPLPAVKDAGWARSPIDLFILAKLEEKKMAPAAPAGRRSLIRRVTFGLLGLPPTFEEVAAFEADDAPDALEKVVERCLASPRYGERWGRHWLDVARYADTKGYVFQEERRFPYAYTYRDYVIRAFNEDLPYDRFILEQIAADQLQGEDRRALAAMGFLTLGRRFLNNQADIIDDRIDVVTRGFLGLTVTCARCHDHKFDPIPTRDYYSLYGVFAGSREPAELPLIASPAETPAYQAFKAEVAEKEAAVTRFLEKKKEEVAANLRQRAGDYLKAVASRKDRGDAAADEKPQQPAAGELHPLGIRRWRNFLEETAKSPHPVFAPWHALSALPEAEFAARAPAALAALAGGAARVNPLVARALSAFPPQPPRGGADAFPPQPPRGGAGAFPPPPASMSEVAERYGSLFAEAEKRWKELREAKQEPPPAALPDRDLEELRQVLYAPGSPAALPEREFERFFDRAIRNQLRELRKKVDALKANSPNAPPRAMVLEDLAEQRNPRVFIRGNASNPGEEVPRQFLAAITRGERTPFRKGSGRLELAQAIASPQNPLTARVMVNRVWLHHFGKGLVGTPSDFGTRSDPPLHRELLDWLASRFIESGWSVKALQRLIVLSSVYRQSAEGDPRFAESDPENRYYSRAGHRRLEFEELRDSLLAVSGRLDEARGGPAVEITAPPFSRRRTVYGFIERQNLPGVFRTFDFASPDTTSPQRFVTTVPQQALFLMNNGFVAEAARALAARIGPGTEDPAGAVRLLYRLAYSRDAAPEEVALALRFLAERKAEAADRPPAKPDAPNAWARYAQVLLLTNEFAFLD